MKIHAYTDEDFAAVVDALVNRADLDLRAHDETVRGIIEEVRRGGDEAALACTNRFDQTEFGLEELEVRPEEIRAAYDQLSGLELEALKTAAGNIRKFHERQKQTSWEYKDNGVGVGQMVRPLERVGVYVPGGKAAYPSSVLMNAIPAQVAGVKEIVMCSPTPRGESRPHCLVAADLAGVARIFKIGGAQAVAAMAYGTRRVPRVDKIVGPGNVFVALAKRLVFGIVDIDMIAGPSEILIIADETARPEFVAADLLSQAEHDEEAVPILVTPSADLARQVIEQIGEQKERLRRKTIIEACLSGKAKTLVVASLEDAVALANRVAPEHLELAVKNPEKWAGEIQNAGAVFLGHFTPEAIGDYLAGPNHVLPTSGTARFSSPLGVYDFIKRTSLISYSKQALKNAAGICCSLAEMEALDAHANAVKIRVI
ncbi:MAG: histidinol dehydrogenase [Nitrospinales bacterium]